MAVTVGLADTMMVASAGEAAVSGVSLVNMISTLILSIFSALATGGVVVVSQNLGAGKVSEACRSAKQLLFTMLCISASLGALVLLLREGLLTLFFGSIEADVRQAALIYLMISCLSFPFLGLYNSCAALLRAMGRTGVTFKVSVLANLLNVVGNAVCVFGLHMGVAGVAIPTLITRIFKGFVLYVLLKKPRFELWFDKERFRPDREIIRNILYIAVPSGVENGIFQLGRIIVISIVSGFGTIQIAANGVAGGLDNLGCIVGTSVNLAIITVIGRCVGADDKEQIRYYTRKLIGITYLSTIIINTVMLLNLHPILSLYGLEPETTALAYTLVMIHNGVAMILWPLSFTLPNMLRACNDVRFTMAVSVFSMIVFRIGFSYVFGKWMAMGVVGVWIAMLLDWAFRTVFFVGRYRMGCWQKTMYRLKK